MVPRGIILSLVNTNTATESAKINARMSARIDALNTAELAGDWSAVERLTAAMKRDDRKLAALYVAPVARTCWND